MKGLIKYYLILFVIGTGYCQNDFNTITIDQDITKVQPLTGIAFWPGNTDSDTDAITLEYSYMLYNDVVKEKGVYDWTVVENVLDDIASRNHQAILRFRFIYPNYETSVPDYIKALADYEEIDDFSEGDPTSFADWRHPELQRFTLEFYEKYAEKYDNDARLAYVQTGFGLWAEYHIYDGPFELGRTFPSKDFQSGFLIHLDSLFKETQWSISIDAASDRYSPFSENPELKELSFGVFDDSFMHEYHSSDNLPNWIFFNRERYFMAAIGGEFSYLSSYDEQNALNPHVGAYGTAFEEWVEEFQMTYINGNDKNRYHSLDRIKEAGRYMGYRFKINSFLSKEGESIVEIESVGVAPIYYDAYVAVNGVRAIESLKLLLPGQKLTCNIAAGGENPTLTIKSDRILETQTIDFYGTENEPFVYVKEDIEAPITTLNEWSSQLNISIQDKNIHIAQMSEGLDQILIYNLQGTIVYEDLSVDKIGETVITLDQNREEVLIMKTNLGTVKLLLSEHR